MEDLHRGDEEAEALRGQLTAARDDEKSNEPRAGLAAVGSTLLPSTVTSIVPLSWRAASAVSLTLTSSTVAPSCLTTNWLNHWFVKPPLA